MNNVNVGILFLLGQISDAIATTLVGFVIDKFGLCGLRYGKRKSWHLVGSLLIVLSFPVYYFPPPNFDRYQIEDNGGKQKWGQTHLVRIILFW